MFKFNKKSLKKFVTVSASALMLISAGGGAVSAMHTNVNASDLSNTLAEDANGAVPESTKRDEAMVARNTYIDSIKDPEDAAFNIEDEAYNPYFRNNATYWNGTKNAIKKDIKKNINKNKSDFIADEGTLDAADSRNPEKALDIIGENGVRENYKQAKSHYDKRLKIVHKKMIKHNKTIKRAHKRMTKRNRKISKISNRKHRTHKAKRSAKKAVHHHNIRRHVRKYIKKSKRVNK